MLSFDYKRILLCLEQKNLIMKDILNLTRRIEVLANREEVVLDTVLSERQNRIERLIKCDKLISDELSSADDTIRSHLRELLSGNADAIVGNEEKSIVDLVNSTQAYLSRTLEIDKSATEILQKKREEARLALVEINNEKPMKN